MWNYEKRLQYPVNIKTPNAKIAQFIMSQYGGPDGEIGASMRYLSQRFTMPNRMAMAVLNDIGTEDSFPEITRNLRTRTGFSTGVSSSGLSCDACPPALEAIKPIIPKVTASTAIPKISIITANAMLSELYFPIIAGDDAANRVHNIINVFLTFFIFFPSLWYITDISTVCNALEYFW